MTTPQGGPTLLQTAVPAGRISAADLTDPSARAAVYATRGRGDGTRRAYRAAWSPFHPVGRKTRWAAIPTPSPALGYLRPAELWTKNVSARVFATAGPALEDV